MQPGSQPLLPVDANAAPDADPSRASSARVDREGRLVLQSCLAEAWLVKEAAAIQLASLIPDGRSPLRQ